MTKRDLFKILIKTLGLYLAIITLFNVLPGYVSYAISEFNVYSIVSLLSTIIIPGLIIAVLIFRADEIIDLLKLNKGFDEDRIEFGNLKADSLLKLTVIGVALFLIVTSLPTFLHHTLLAFRDMVTNKGVDGVLESHTYGKADFEQIITSVISLIIGFLMITNFTYLAKWLEKANQNNS